MAPRTLARLVTLGLVFWGTLITAFGFFTERNGVLVAGVMVIVVALAVNAAWGA